jgi:polar amino acid transport system substrate-binding protein
MPGRSPRPFGRRVLLPLALPFLLPAPRAHAQADGDGSLARARARGRLLVLNGPAMALPAEARGTSYRLHDPYNAAIAALIAEELGLACEVLFQTGTGMLPALLSGEADIALPTLLTRLNASRIMFSHPHAMLDAVILSALPRRLRGADSLAGLRVGLLESHALAFGNEAGLPDHALVTRLADLPALEEALLAREIEAALLPAPQARALVARNPGSGLSARFTLRLFTYAAAVRFGDHDLLRAVNGCLAEALHDGRLAALFRRETGLPLPPLAPL